MAEAREIESAPEALAGAEHDGRDDEVHLVDDALLEILADGRDAASDADIVRAGGFLCAAERLVEATDEVERGAALHLDGRVRVGREDERGHVIWRVVSPASP